MTEVTDAEFADARAAGDRLEATEPRAVAARFDPKTATIVIVLRNGCTFGFPARLGQGLEAATDAELAQVEVDGRGYGLRWDALDVDLAVPRLLMGQFGGEAHMRRLGEAEPIEPRAA